MPEQGAQDDTANQAEDNAHEKQKKHLRPLWLSDVVSGWLCVTFSGLLLACGAAFLNSRPKPVLLAWGLIFIAVSLVGAAAYFWLINHRKKQAKNKMPAIVPSMVCVIIIALGLMVSVFARVAGKTGGCVRFAPFCCFAYWKISDAYVS
jgi:hypothetical protein